MLTIVITGLVLMRARSLLEVPSSSSDVWKEWELRGVVFLSLALQIVLICLGSCRKYFPHTLIKVVTWSAYLLADSVAIYAIGMISNMIREIKAGKSLSNPHTELSTFWAPFLLLHLGGPDTISAYAIEDNELWLRHSLTLVNQAGLTVYVLVMAWTHPTLSFLAILILLSGFYKYGERVWVLRAASQKYFKDSFMESPLDWKGSGKIGAELKREEGYDVVPHHVIDVNNEDAIEIDVAIAEFCSKKLSFVKELEDQGYERIAGTLLSARRLVNTSQRLFADHLFSMEERDSCLSILRGKHCAGDFKVIEIELGLIYDMFYSKAKAVYMRWGFICRLAILFSICVALVIFFFTDKRPYSKPDLFLTFLLLGAAIFIELYALAHVLFSDQVACWLIERKQSAVFHFINRLAHVLFSDQVACWLNEKKQSAVFYFITRIRPSLKRRRWSNSMGQYNLMSFQKKYFRWWSFLKLSHVEEMAVKFLYPSHVPVSDDVKKLIMSKIKEMEARVQEMDETELQDFRMRDRGIHALSTHGSLTGQLEWSIKFHEFDESILIWHIATELCYYLDYGWQDSTKELERNNQSAVEKKCLMGLHLSRYMLYLQYMCPSMLPARFGSIRFQDIYKEPSKGFNLAKSALNRPACGRNGRERKPDISEESEIPEGYDALLWKMRNKILESMSEEYRGRSVVANGCLAALELQRVPRGRKWEAISEVWVEMLMYGANKCKARDHAQHMRGGGELITHVWLLMSHYGLTDSFKKERDLPPTAEIIVNPW